MSDQKPVAASSESVPEVPTLIDEFQRTLQSLQRYDYSADGMVDAERGHYVEFMRLPWAVIGALGRAGALAGGAVSSSPSAEPAYPEGQGGFCHRRVNDGRHICRQQVGHDGTCRPNINAPAAPSVPDETPPNRFAHWETGLLCERIVYLLHRDGVTGDDALLLRAVHDRLHALYYGEPSALPPQETATSEQREQEIQARLDAATPGPWTRGGMVAEGFATYEEQYNVYPPLGECGPVADVGGKTNADLIANAPADLAHLLASLRSERARADAAEQDFAWQRNVSRELYEERDRLRLLNIELRSSAERDATRLEWRRFMVESRERADDLTGYNWDQKCAIRNTLTTLIAAWDKSLAASLPSSDSRGVSNNGEG